MTSAPTTAFPTAERIILVADLAGFHRAFMARPDHEMAAFLDEFYALAADVIEGHGGHIVKFLGDAVLASFPPDRAAAALASAAALDAAAAGLVPAGGLDIALGCNVHVGPVVAADLGRGQNRRPDMVGRAVNETFLLGRGGGARISTALWERLSTEDRGAWVEREAAGVFTPV